MDRQKRVLLNLYNGKKSRVDKQEQVGVTVSIKVLVPDLSQFPRPEPIG